MYQVVKTLSHMDFEKKLNELEREGYKVEKFQAFQSVTGEKLVAIMHKENEE